MRLAPALTFLLLVLCGADASCQPAGASLDEAMTMHQVEAPVELVDRTAFISESAITNVLLSPDGNYVTWLASENHHAALHLLQLESGEKSRLFSSASISAVYWTSDSSHLILDLGMAVGVVNLANPARPAYIAMLEATRSEKFLGSANGVLDHIMITGRHDDGSYALKQVTINGDSHELLRQDAMIVSAVAAADGDSAVVVSATATGHRFMLVNGEEQTPLFNCELLDTCRLLAYQQQTSTIWLTGNPGSNLINLMRYSLNDRTLVSMHSHADGIVDVAGVVLTGKQPRVVQYHDGLLRNYGLDATMAAQLQTVQALLPNSSFTPQISNDGNIWLITESNSVVQHSRYYLFAPSTGAMTEILQEERSSPNAISADKLSQEIPFKYPAQDGSLLHGYVSLPKGRLLNTAAMITLVHGGPFGRVDSDYSEFTQFLVNRGYIVFEPNFRASTGYGRAYVEQAAGEFGDGVVQQDIIDGVHYLTGQGIGDPERLGIAGHSFGGFAVLSGLAFTPGLFKAGFASAAPADMATVGQFQRTPERTKDMDPSVAAMFNLMFGEVDDAAAMEAMTARSPQSRLADISAPLMLLAGGDDMNVPVGHVKDYALALLNQQKTLSLFLDEDEGHGVGFSSVRSKLAYFWMAEEFFGLYLGGRTQPLDDPALANYIRQNMLINMNPEFSVPAGQ